MLTDEFSKLIEISKEAEKRLPRETKPLINKVIERCNRCLTTCDLTKSKAVQEYAQAILDFTFIDENLLVEESFPRESWKRRIHSIFVDLNSIESIVLKLYPDKDKTEVVDVLGIDIAECLVWRKGALMYMYCATVEEEDKSRIREDPQSHAEQLKSGIQYLQEMLSLRSPLESDRHTESKDSDVGKLLQLGIYSDTHLLAMMYAGEMCYWYSHLENIENFIPSSSLNVKMIGMKHLSEYLKAVKGPLSVHGWSTERAEKLLEYLEKK